MEFQKLGRIESSRFRRKGFAFSPADRKSLLGYFLILLPFLLWMASCTVLPAYTRLELTDLQTGMKLLALTLSDGETVVLNWRNSLFGLDVTERFVVEEGTLVLNEVTYADPGGNFTKPVQPEDVEDLYQTGGPFSAKGLRKIFTQITYRIGEIGNPKLQVRERIVDLKKAVGFGGQVCLAVRKATLYESVFTLFLI